MVVNKRGTFCVVIDARIAVATCPVRGCVYRNLNTSLCVYERTKGLDANALAEATGRPALTDEQQQQIVNQLEHGIKSAL